MAQILQVFVEQHTEPVLIPLAIRAIHTSTLMVVLQDKHNLPLNLMVPPRVRNSLSPAVKMQPSLSSWPQPLLKNAWQYFDIT